ncbi:YhjD/YihY/BrkB family envelope integrity protein [Jatrophihabitans fulvus]
MVVAAALTTYSALGLVPLLAIGVRVATAVFGSGAVLETADGLARYLPGPLHLDDQVAGFARSAVQAPWWTAVLALLPVSIYAEGVVRSLERFSRAPEQRSRALRGRLLSPLFVVLAVVFVLVAVACRPLLDDPFGAGAGARVLGVFIAFNLLFFAVFGALLLVYRLFATTPLRRGPLTVAAFAAASWIAGQSLGYVLAIRLIDGFDNGFGRYAPAAEVAALVFLVYLQHLILVFGYLLALTLHERGASGGADVGGDGAGREGDERQPAAGMGRPADQEQSARQ